MTYQQRIATIVPGANARHVEALMRSVYSTLDSLSPRQFAHECFQCATEARQDPKLAEQLALTFGL